MKRSTIAALVFLLASGQSISQDTTRYITSDTIHVLGLLSEDWPEEPFDSVWMCPGLYVFDASVSFHYPTVAEVYSKDSAQLLLTRETIYRDSLVSCSYHSNGTLKSRHVSGRPTPKLLSTELYYSNDQLRYGMRYDLDTLQLSTTYYANGKKQLEYWWYEWRAFNDWTEWYDDGRLKLQGHYEPGPLTEELKHREPLPIGQWHYFKPNGEPEKIEVYSEGKLIRTKVY